MSGSVSKNGCAEKNGGATTVYLGHVVDPVDEDQYRDIPAGALIVSGDGRIMAVGKWSDLSERYSSSSKIVDCGRKLIMPGMIDMHIHLPQVTQIGKSGDTLLSWLEKYIFPAESKFSDLSHAEKIAAWFFDELASNGTTLAVVFTTVHKEATDAAFRIAADKGMRAIMGKVMMDRNAPPTLLEDSQNSIRDSEGLASKWHGYDDGRLLYAFTPRFAITATDELLRECGKLWQSSPGTYLHTHLSESREEVDKVASLFPQSRSYLDVYDRSGLCGARSVFAHSIHLDDEDLQVMHGKKCALAHCPSSNFFLKSGVFPIDRVKAAGVEFGLGSDVAAGPQMSIFGVMKDANFIQPKIWISPRELFYRATLGGAKALRLEERLGSLEVGKEADFIVIDPTLKNACPKDILDHGTDEILSTIVFLGDDRMIDATYIRGRQVFGRGKGSNAGSELHKVRGGK
ncbi:MAG: guanine deaminase [Candidatus Obscuribacterales bacterium]|nr:guanine deaminase [Candidatus Obscuribacterales bacterium]